jgi:hypothetical protein
MRAWVMLGAALATGACDDAQSSHIFIARAYVAASGCVDPSSGIDVVDGPPPTTGCTPVCVVDQGGNVYVSGMCPPYPMLDKVETVDGGLDPTCAAALAVYECNVTCGVDGGPDSGEMTDAAGCYGGPEAGEAGD